MPDAVPEHPPDSGREAHLIRPRRGGVLHDRITGPSCPTKIRAEQVGTLVLVAVKAKPQVSISLALLDHDS
jgi:hypothetical protein